MHILFGKTPSLIFDCSRCEISGAMRRKPELRAHSRLRKKLRSRLAVLATGSKTPTVIQEHVLLKVTASG